MRSETKFPQILPPLMGQQMPYIVGWLAFNITPGIAEKLTTIRPAAIDRRLKKDNDALRLKGKSLTKPLCSLKSRIPLHRRGAEKARFLANRHRRTSVRHHCGQATFGQYLHTLTATDVASGWVELRSLLNNAHSWTFTALSDIKTTVPLPVLEFHRKQSFRAIMARSLSIMPPKSGAPMHTSPSPAAGTTGKMITVCGPPVQVEQKNGARVREYVGYDRLEGLEEQALLAAVYTPLVPLLNSFMPTQKLTSKTRVGSKKIRGYDEPRNPFQRLLESGELSRERKDALATQCALYNPVQLQ
jgi:hypothetical protein